MSVLFEGSVKESPKADEHFDLVTDIQKNDFGGGDDGSGVYQEEEDNSPTNTVENFAKEQTLAGHLEWQLIMGDLSEDDRPMALEIVHNLSDEGLLETPLEELGKSEQVGFFAGLGS